MDLGDAQSHRFDIFQTNSSGSALLQPFLRWKDAHDRHHFHLLISAAGGHNAVQSAQQLYPWWEAPYMEIETKQPEKIVLILLSHGRMMITQ